MSKPIKVAVVVVVTVVVFVQKKYFRSKRILDPKKFIFKKSWVQINVEKKKFGANKFFGPKI